MGGAIAPLALTLDPAQVREAGRRWRGRNRYGLTIRPAQLIVGLVYLLLGIIGLVILKPASLANMPVITCAVFIVLGAVSALQGVGRLDFQPRPLPIAAVQIDDAALTATDERGVARAYPWRAVKSVERTPSAMVFVLTWRRAIVIPATIVAAYEGELWPQLYAHLVDRRGLRPTPVDRVNEIVNTALM